MRPNRSKSTHTKSYSTLFLFLMADFSFLSTFQYALKAHCDTEDSQQGFINRVIPFQIFPNPVTPMVIRELSITFYFKRETRICITKTLTRDLLWSLDFTSFALFLPYLFSYVTLSQFSLGSYQVPHWLFRLVSYIIWIILSHPVLCIE